MTADDHESAPVSLPDTDLPAAHASVTLLERLADKLGGRASVRAVYCVSAPPTPTPCAASCATYLNDQTRSLKINRNDYG
ncbi:hypothetical protein [Streptomyces sp. YIM S03343]